MSDRPADEGTSKRGRDKDQYSPRATARQPTSGSSSDSNRVNAPHASRPATTNTSRSTGPDNSRNHPDPRPSYAEGQTLSARQNTGQVLASSTHMTWAKVASANTTPSSNRNPPNPLSSQQRSGALPTRSMHLGSHALGSGVPQASSQRHRQDTTRIKHADSASTEGSRLLVGINLGTRTILVVDSLLMEVITLPCK